MLLLPMPQVIRVELAPPIPQRPLPAGSPPDRPAGRPILLTHAMPRRYTYCVCGTQRPPNQPNFPRRARSLRPCTTVTMICHEFIYCARICAGYYSWCRRCVPPVGRQHPCQRPSQRNHSAFPWHAVCYSTIRANARTHTPTVRKLRKRATTNSLEKMGLMQVLCRRPRERILQQNQPLPTRPNSCKASVAQKRGTVKTLESESTKPSNGGSLRLRHGLLHWLSPAYDIYVRGMTGMSRGLR